MTSNEKLLSVALFVLALEVLESFAVRKEASDIFSMKLGWRLFYYVTVVLSISQTIHDLPLSHRSPNGMPIWWPLLFLALALLSRPRTIIVNSGGLASYGWYGFRRRFLPWADVSGVTSEWEEKRLALNFTTFLWMFTGFNVGVAGPDGTRIVHTIALRGQSGFLDDLRQHVPAGAFAPGLFDWHPSA